MGKPRSEWSEAYRKRIESAERRGLTYKEAQGKGGYRQLQKQKPITLVSDNRLRTERQKGPGRKVAAHDWRQVYKWAYEMYTREGGPGQHLSRQQIITDREFKEAYKGIKKFWSMSHSEQQEYLANIDMDSKEYEALLDAMEFLGLRSPTLHFVRLGETPEVGTAPAPAAA